MTQDEKTNKLWNRFKWLEARLTGLSAIVQNPGYAPSAEHMQEWFTICAKFKEDFDALVAEVGIHYLGKNFKGENI